mgnify:CR=1 FL=1
MKAKAPSVLLLAGLLFGGAALAMPSAENSDAVLPNSPLKERGYPDAGRFNPVGGGVVMGVGFGLVGVAGGVPLAVALTAASGAWLSLGSPERACAKAVGAR